MIRPCLAALAALLLLALLLLAAPARARDARADVDALLAADRAFSAAAARAGSAADGLAPMFDAEAAMPVPGTGLVVGRAAVIAAFRDSPAWRNPRAPPPAPRPRPCHSPADPPAQPTRLPAPEGPEGRGLSLISNFAYKRIMVEPGFRAAEFRTIEIDLAVHRAIERQRRSVGESENDILRRALLPGRRPVAPPRGPEGTRRGEAGAGRSRGEAGAGRSRGLWSVEIGGQRLPAANLKDAFRILLLALAAAHPHFLHAFAQEAARGRRYVARSPSGLYLRSPHLARAHAHKLVAGWYFDSNLSSAQVAKRARIAARLCGLFYGQDVRILDNLRQI